MDEAKLGEEDINRSSQHVFQVIQYLRKLCSHPALVFDASHPKYCNLKEKASEEVNGPPSSRLGHPSLDWSRNIALAPKLVALKDLLFQCLGRSASRQNTDKVDKGSMQDEDVIGGHRLLVFAQLKSMLDLVEDDLFQSHLPGLNYLRLDGSVSSEARFEIVERFNNDPTISVLLLTTHVGGLGLNLTGADTVVFLEHDYNPMKDLQAMDRAHRIGQKRVVNVYRLITKNTLEEKIMGLQRFKINLANSVVSHNNASLQSMEPSRVLDLFATAPLSNNSLEKTAGNKTSSTQQQTGLAGMLSSLEQLWDEQQYKESYDLETFIKSLHGRKLESKTWKSFP